jgi:hypothetical protein
MRRNPRPLCNIHTRQNQPTTNQLLQAIQQRINRRRQDGTLDQTLSPDLHTQSTTTNSSEIHHHNIRLIRTLDHLQLMALTQRRRLTSISNHQRTDHLSSQLILNNRHTVRNSLATIHSNRLINHSRTSSNHLQLQVDLLLNSLLKSSTTTTSRLDKLVVDMGNHNRVDLDF